MKIIHYKTRYNEQLQSSCHYESIEVPDGQKEAKPMNWLLKWGGTDNLSHEI